MNRRTVLSTQTRHQLITRQQLHSPNTIGLVGDVLNTNKYQEISSLCYDVTINTIGQLTRLPWTIL